MSSKKTKNSKKQNIDHRRITLLLSTVVVLVISLVGTVFNDWSTVVSNRKETAELQKKYELLLEEEASLNSEVTKLQDPTYVARYAREKYLYSKDGETILRIIDNSSNEKEKNSEIEG